MEDGKICYDTYKDAVGGLMFNGEKMKEFSEMPDYIRKINTLVEESIVEIKEILASL